jgi:hypothetical protein
MTAHTKTVDVGEMGWLRISMYPLNLFLYKSALEKSTTMEPKKVKIKRFVQLVGSGCWPFRGLNSSLQIFKSRVEDPYSFYQNPDTAFSESLGSGSGY